MTDVCRKRIVRVIAIDEVKGLRTGRKGSSINHKKVDWDPCVMLLIMASLFMPSEFAVLPGVAMVVRVCASAQLRTRMMQVPYVKCLMLFCISLMTVTVMNGDLASIGVGVCLCLAMLAAVYLRVCIDRPMLLRMLEFCCYGAIFCLLIAVVQECTFGTSEGYRCTSVFANPNYYAMMMEFTVLAAMYLWMRRGNKPWLYALAIVACLLGLLLSNSRTAMVAAVASALVLTLLLRNTKAFLIGLSVCVIAGVGMLMVPGALRLTGMQAELHTRTLLWKVALEGFLQSPLVGQGAWAFARVAAASPVIVEVHAHNLLFELLLSSGVLGVSMIGLYFYHNHKSAYQLYKAKKDDGLMALLVSVTMALGLHGLMDVTIFAPQAALFFMMICSVSGLAERQKAPVHVRVLTPVPMPSWVGPHLRDSISTRQKEHA